MEREQFTKVVEEVLDSLPREFRCRIQNVGGGLTFKTAITQVWPAKAIASRYTSNGPVKAIERTIAGQTRSNPGGKGYGQSGISTDSATHTFQSEDPEQSTVQGAGSERRSPKPLSEASPAKQASKRDDGALRSPWQNSYAERLIGSLRRECLDHVIVFDETAFTAAGRR